ncbi:hypothetical protein [Nannocystis sp. SCPEA4]|nr:hypothetical protein [Nannocystis sp. SCPEA4]MCY1059317.1 hypothetical protein [Nannocystis sp. SCPEA4]
MQLPDPRGPRRPIPADAPMTDLFFIAVVLASFTAFWGLMRLLGRL